MPQKAKRLMRAGPGAVGDCRVVAPRCAWPTTKRDGLMPQPERPVFRDRQVEQEPAPFWVRHHEAFAQNSNGYAYEHDGSHQDGNRDGGIGNRRPRGQSVDPIHGNLPKWVESVGGIQPIIRIAPVHGHVPSHGKVVKAVASQVRIGELGALHNEAQKNRAYKKDNREPNEQLVVASLSCRHRAAPSLTRSGDSILTHVHRTSIAPPFPRNLETACFLRKIVPEPLFLFSNGGA